MKNKKPKSKINKWKLTAIISLVVNGLVALLLTIGLATPKSYVKASSYSTPINNAYLYTLPFNSTAHLNELRSSSSLWNEVEDLAYEHSDDFSEISVNPDALAYNYKFQLSNGDFLMSSSDFELQNAYNFYYVELRFSVLTSGDYQGECVLDYLYFSPSNDANGFAILYNREIPYSNDFTYNFVYSNNYSLNVIFSRLYTYQGSNEAYKDYVIRDGWNPNKYISIASDSIGLLFDSPSSSAWLPNPQVKWVSPIYYHDYTLPTGRVQKVSTLGFLEIPLLFESNGEMFNGIRLYYDVYHHYIDKDGSVKHTSPETSAVGGITTNAYHYGFVYMSYTYILSSGLGAPLTSWKEKVVSAVPVYQITQDIFTDSIEYREFIYQPFEPYKWLNNEYKIIHTFDYSKPSLNRVGVNENVSRSRFAINQLTIEEVLEYDMSVGGSPVGSNTYLGDAFALIRDAFASILPILSLSILPNITIGMLIFIPLVLTIIIVVIKLVKR